VDGGGEHKVHKVILAAQSPVFEQFFEKHEQVGRTALSMTRY
jgi:hypothetical protein